MTIFEKIVIREITAFIVYEDDLSLAFLDISQSTKGHTLVIPKNPYKNILEVPEDILKHLIKVTKDLSKAINDAFEPEGINILNNNGSVAGQTVFHFHIHIIPRYDSNEVKFVLENNTERINRDEYKKRAEMIISAL